MWRVAFFRRVAEPSSIHQVTMQTKQWAFGWSRRAGVARRWGWVFSGALLPLSACSDRVDIAKELGKGGNGNGGEVSFGGSENEEGGSKTSGGTKTSGGSSSRGGTSSNGGALASTGGALASSGGTTSAFFCDGDSSCNDDPRASALWGRCVKGTCVCNEGFVVNPGTGRCAIGSEASWEVESDWSILLVDAAANGDAGVVLQSEYQFRDQTTVSRVRLSRIGSRGTRVGTSELVYEGASTQHIQSLTVAGDGERYLYCWSLVDAVRCFALDPNASSEEPVFEATGTSVEVAFSDGHWVVAYTPTVVQGRAEVVLQRLDGDWQPDLAPVIRYRTGTGLEGKPLLAAHADGFVFVGDAEGSDNAHIYQFDHELKQLSMTQLRTQFSGRGAVAATTSQVAVALAAPYVGRFFSVNFGRAFREQEVAGGFKAGFLGAFAESDDQLFVNWLSPDAALNSLPVFNLGEGRPAPEGDDTEFSMIRLANQWFAVVPTPVPGSSKTGVQIRAVSGF